MAFVGILQHVKARQALEGPAAGGLRNGVSNGGECRNPASATHWAFLAAGRLFVRPCKRRRKRRIFYALTVF